MLINKGFCLIVAVLLLISSSAFAAEARTSNDATPITAELNQQWYDLPEFSDETEFTNATRGLIEAHFGKIDVKAVIYSHSHADYFGGVGWSMQILPIRMHEAYVPTRLNSWAIQQNQAHGTTHT